MSGNQGKYAEGKVRYFLEDWKQKVAGFTYNRILDARSSMGKMSNPQPGDFQWFLNLGYTFGSGPHERHATRNGLLEIKETKHAYRLDFNSFGADQVGRMVIRQMAGSECLVLLCHRAERKPIWRAVPLDHFRERPGPKYGSWDLTEFPATYSLASILEPYLS